MTKKHRRRRRRRSPRKKNTITLLELVAYEAAARWEVWVEQGCPRFKTGRTVDKKKAHNKRACRGRVEQED